jgi:hypothetical protein
LNKRIDAKADACMYSAGVGGVPTTVEPPKDKSEETPEWADNLIKSFQGHLDGVSIHTRKWILYASTND